LLKNGEEELNVKVYSVEAIECEHKYPIGTLITNKQELKVAAKNGLILLNEIKLPGKRKMDVKSLLNGFEFHTEAKML
jgi:methionyl-tRNA formyltransferase